MQERRRGLEPDECYYVANEPLVHGKDEIDLRSDPPPDLAIEIDVKHSSLDRMAIYAVLGVAEVWRFDGTSLTINVLGVDGKYAVVPSGHAFPRLTAADLMSFMNLRGQLDDNALVGQFRTWVRQHLAAAGGTTP